jgi:hypothetical protein
VVATGGHNVILKFEVFPTKLDYTSDYVALLEDISRHHANLLFSYFQSTHRRTGVGPEMGDRVGWLSILRSEVELLAKSIDRIQRNPLVQLRADVQIRRVDSVKRISSSSVAAINQGKGTGPWIHVGGFVAREKIPDQSRQSTVDVPEHRWILGNLQLIESQVRRIRRELDATSLAGTDPPRVTAKVETLEELAALSDAVRALSRAKIFVQIQGDVNAMDKPSIAILSKSGYSEIYRSLRVITRALTIEGNVVSASVNDLAVLYEQWCFLEIADAVLELFPESERSADYFEIAESFLSNRIVAGTSSIGICSATAEITVSYNENFPSLTGAHKPDISIRISRDGRPTLLLILDAKYRVNYPTSDNKWIGPGAESVNALHRYRDSVVVASDGYGSSRPVVKGVALFPANPDQAANFEKSPLYRSLDILGVGALPFLPSNRATVRAWLARSIRELDDTLLNSGPRIPREIEIE